MGWNFTNDPERYAEWVHPLLTRRPAANTVALTVLDSLRSGHRYGPAEPVLGWYTEDGAVTGAVSTTPPFGLLLSELPASSEAELAAQLRARQVPVPSVNGTVGTVERFVAAWLPAGSPGGSPATELIMRQRLYSLTELRPPDPAPDGSPRVATVAELELVVDWLTAFQQEVEPWVPPPAGSAYQRRIDLGLLWFWLDGAGQPVSVAGRNVTIAGTCRVGPVYTPPAARKQGYGAAATAACTRDALDRGAEHVVLFTDLANPTSNGIYQRLGYQPVQDRVIVRLPD